MDREKYLILINGQDKTDSVKEFRPCGDSCDIIYTSSSQVYHYQGGKVKILELQQRVDPAGLIVTVKGIRVPIILALVGVVLGGVGLRGNRRGKGMAIAGLVTSIIALVPTVIVIATGSAIISGLSSL